MHVVWQLVIVLFGFDTDFVLMVFFLYLNKLGLAWLDDCMARGGSLAGGFFVCFRRLYRPLGGARAEPQICGSPVSARKLIKT